MCNFTHRIALWIEGVFSAIHKHHPSCQALMLGCPQTGLSVDTPCENKLEGTSDLWEREPWICLQKAQALLLPTVFLCPWKERYYKKETSRLTFCICDHQVASNIKKWLCHIWSQKMPLKILFHSMYFIDEKTRCKEIGFYELLPFQTYPVFDSKFSNESAFARWTCFL